MTALRRSLHLVTAPRGGADEEKMFRIAFASSDLRHVNEHFGTATRFVIYQVSAGYSRLERVVGFDPEVADGRESKLEPRLASLMDCDAVHCCAVGASAARLLLRQGVQPVRLEGPSGIGNLVAAIQHSLASGRSPWENHLMHREKNMDRDRFQELLHETWEE
ncbi:MAG: nitrogen fixation protein NifX [Magnetococcales bacterium]|nr:nitrogen fixation protein NifX [Magnetococcales bacterium]MBF0151626.1 nitrogen fixation protein NifX [Magnetococcales bacterium]